jgi:hypothetical protein
MFSRRRQNARARRLAVLLVAAAIQGIGAKAGAAEDVAPRMAGSYRPAPPGIHPYVFTTGHGLDRLLSARTPITGAALRRLEDQVKGQLARLATFTAAYEGCDLDEYLKHFSYGADAAAGTAAALALYASLAERRQGYGSAGLALQASSAAKAILLAWARRGMREAGTPITDPRQFCDAHGQRNDRVWMLVSLQLGRGMPPWVQAQDLLLGLAVFSAAEEAELNGFVDRMSALVRSAANLKAAIDTRPCERFNNQTSANLYGLAAMARLRNDARAMTAVANGAGQLTVPFTLQVQETIYGPGEPPRGCYGATGDPRFYAETDHPAAGEVVDRYRAEEYQTFGYTLGSLQELLMAARLLQSSGFQAYDYAGAHGQTLRSGLDYYAYYFTQFMTAGHSLVPAGPDRYRDYQQYVGKAVSRAGGATVDGRDNLIQPYITGAVMYPDDSAIAAVLRKAESFSADVVPLYGVDSISLPDLAELKQAAPKP